MSSFEFATGRTIPLGAGGDKCANCDHFRADHSGHFPEIVCVSLGTDPAHHCTCDEFEEPAAQTPEGSLHSANVVFDSDSSPDAAYVIPHPFDHTHDRTEGEGPYKVGDKITILVGDWLDESAPPSHPLVTKLRTDGEAGIANAAYLEGQASTHPRIQHLERIEEAAKKVAQQQSLGLITMDDVGTTSEIVGLSELRAALSSDNGETE
ncbi:hypothetical protein [Sinimarinibacterium flocculans]|uniref:hypothetical protein n=1 Tax=Sinimarinibacterium flocculans TaxID=985250 RepID=UPI002492AC21|nr:hypothetical protein [Sinimarinibacterium flocculans]